MRLKLTCLALVLAFLTSCAPVTIIDRGGTEGRPPDYEQSQPAWLLGVIGTSHIYLDEVCKSNLEPQKIVIEHTWKDILWSPIAAVYYPKTVKIWCENREPSI